jgi:hypothetical protein
VRSCKLRNELCARCCACVLHINKSYKVHATLQTRLDNQAEHNICSTATVGNKSTIKQVQCSSSAVCDEIAPVSTQPRTPKRKGLLCTTHESTRSITTAGVLSCLFMAFHTYKHTVCVKSPQSCRLLLLEVVVSAQPLLLLTVELYTYNTAACRSSRTARNVETAKWDDHSAALQLEHQNCTFIGCRCSAAAAVYDLCAALGCCSCELISTLPSRCSRRRRRWHCSYSTSQRKQSANELFALFKRAAASAAVH